MSRRDPDVWPLDTDLLQHFGCYAFKRHTKFEQNRIIIGWIIDDSARFRVQFFFFFWGGGSELTVLSQGCMDPFTKLGYDIKRSSHFCFRIRISCCIFKRGRLKDERCFKRPQISHFLTPPPVKIRGGVGEISISIVETFPPTELTEYIWWPSSA